MEQRTIRFVLVPVEPVGNISKLPCGARGDIWQGDLCDVGPDFVLSQSAVEKSLSDCLLLSFNEEMLSNAGQNAHTAASALRLLLVASWFRHNYTLVIGHVFEKNGAIRFLPNQWGQMVAPPLSP